MSEQILAKLAHWIPTGSDYAKAMPELQDITLQQSQKKAIEGNIAELPQITALASGINKFNFDELKKMYEASVPGYDEMMTTGGADINSMLKGELPLDVQRQIARSSGAKSFAGGYGGSPMAGAAQAETLGLSSLGLIQEGLGASERWLASAQGRLPHLADTTSMFVSPMQQLTADVNERNTQWSRLWAKRQLELQPKGLKAAAIGITDWLENIGASAATMGIGGAMGSGGGMGGMGGGSGGAKTSLATIPSVDLGGGSNMNTGEFLNESSGGFNSGYNGMF